MAKESHESYVTVYKSVEGWKAVMVCWNDDEPELGGFWEPYQTGIGSYETREQATKEAKVWAREECLEFREGL